MFLPLRALLVTALFAVASFAQATKASQEAPTKRYEVETGHFQITKTTKSAGVTIDVREDVYFQDWGRTEARFSTTTTVNPFLQGEQKSRGYSLRKDGVLVLVDLDKKTGTRMKDPGQGPFGNLSAAQQQGLGEGVMKAFGAEPKELPDEDVAGKTCKVVETKSELGGMEMVTTIWTWKGIQMRSASSGFGSEMTELVTKIETGIDVPQDKLVLPEGVTIRDVKQPFGANGLGLGGMQRR